MRLARRLGLASAAALLALSGVAAHAQARDDDERAREETWHKASGKFGAMLIVTDRYADLAKGWNEPAEDGEKPSVTLTESTARGDAVTAAITFSGCTPGIIGRCLADADFIVLKPDGSTYATHRKVPVSRAKPPAEGKAGLAEGRVRLRVEGNDPLGTWTIRAIVRDRIANTQVTLEWPILVKAESWSPGQRGDWPIPTSTPALAASPALPGI